VFCASVFAHRAKLGDTVTAWLEAHPEIELVDVVVTQSSDAYFHLISICVFYKGELAASVETLTQDPRAPMRCAGAAFRPTRSSE
jgi:hypothetical protein